MNRLARWFVLRIVLRFTKLFLKVVGKVESAFLKVWHLPRKVLIPGSLVVVGVIAVGGYKADAAIDYMENDPSFCRSCHIMETAWDRWSSSEHKEVTCHKCHEQTMIQSTSLLLRYTLGMTEDAPSHALVDDERCATCHESGNKEWVQVASTAGHEVHVEGQRVSCTKCHSVTLHRFTPPGPICSVCHEEKKVEVPRMGEMHCLTCHEFLKPVPLEPDPSNLQSRGGETPSVQHDLLPTREPCLSCHVSQGRTDITWPVDAPMQFECKTCHDPHKQAAPVVDCKSCHQETKTAGLHVNVVHQAASCQTCHQPHEWKVSDRQACETCHADRKAHNAPVSCNLCHNFKPTKV